MSIDKMTQMVMTAKKYNDTSSTIRKLITIHSDIYPSLVRKKIHYAFHIFDSVCLADQNMVIPHIVSNFKRIEEQAFMEACSEFDNADSSLKCDEISIDFLSDQLKNNEQFSGIEKILMYPPYAYRLYNFSLKNTICLPNEFKDKNTQKYMEFSVFGIQINIGANFNRKISYCFPNADKSGYMVDYGPQIDYNPFNRSFAISGNFHIYLSTDIIAIHHNEIPSSIKSFSVTNVDYHINEYSVSKYLIMD